MNGKRFTARPTRWGCARPPLSICFGCGEEIRHRVNHLERLRRVQEDTGGFTAFIPWIFAPENTPLGKKIPETTAFDYLKTLAISAVCISTISITSNRVGLPRALRFARSVCSLGPTMWAAS